MTCPELVRRKQNNRYRSKEEIKQLAERVNCETDLSRYLSLHQEGKQLISGWFERAWKKRDCESENSFEPFIFSFIALNAWAARVTGRDHDPEWLEALTLNREIGTRFSRLAADGASPVATYAMEFRQMWPIFKVQDLRKQGIRPHLGHNRLQMIDNYLSQAHKKGISLKFAPQCWESHREKGEEIPLDWPHTLAALYRVRCNLFHGEKGQKSEVDREIVARALRILVYFLDEIIFVDRPLYR